MDFVPRFYLAANARSGMGEGRKATVENTRY
jgi:hypothetical protein